MTESGCRAGYDGAKRHNGSKARIVDTLGQLFTVVITNSASLTANEHKSASDFA
jgi:hypothetical protein